MRTNSSFFTFLLLLVMFGLTGAALLSLESCCGHDCQIDRILGEGGGQDNIVVDMPFAAGYGSRCVQGAGGGYSHAYTSTAHDADLDTPNDQDVIVYAPVDGIASVHDTRPTRGFGNHVNIDIGDGTYVLLGHMAEIFISDQSDVTAGQILGYEGTTGYSTGDHMHIGRHDGDAAADATYGTSIEGLTFLTAGGTTAVDDLVCGLTSGATYTSVLATPAWHPNGTLVKTPDDATVYLLENGEARAFYTQDAFFSRNYDFANVAIVDGNELSCYGVGANIASSNAISAVYDGGAIWLVFPESNEVQRVGSTGWQAVLKSWGITASTYDDLPGGDERSMLAEYSVRSGNAEFREGTLVSEASSSTVYVVADGTAMPIETWDVLLLMGFAHRAVLEVDDGLVTAVMHRVGSCSGNVYCLTREDVTTCGGPEEEEEGTFSSSSLTLTWTTPDGLLADRITLAGEYAHADGRVEAWRTLAESTGSAALDYALLEPASGDSLRFSVEFAQRGATSWSCLSPYPPGTAQGTARATFNGAPLAVSVADDPASDGCGLRVTIP